MSEMRGRTTGSFRPRAVLTGATGGIGKAIAHALAPRCEWLILTGRNQAALRTLQTELGASSVHVVAGSLNDDHTLQRIASMGESLGGANLLINNAGTSAFHAFETQSAAAIRSILETNTLAPMLMTRELLPQLKAAPQAQIINIGSVFGSIGFPGFAAYCASKSGLRGFSQALRRELADTKVTVRHFAPRATRTPINTAAVTAMNRELNTAEDAPERVAQQLMQFIDGAAWEKTLGGKEAFFVFINRLLPGIPDKAMLAQLPIIRKYLPR